MLNSVYVLVMDALIRGGKPKKGAVELLDLLYRQNVPFVVLSQQSGKSRDTVVKEMRAAGFRTFRHANLYTSSMAAVDFLSSHFPEKKQAAVIGGEGVREAVEKAEYHRNHLHPDFVFAGMDRTLNYDDYCDVCAMIAEGGILVSVDDRRTQVVENQKLIGNGSIVHMMEYATKTDAIHFGIGSPLLLDMVLRYMKADASVVVFVGTSFVRDLIPALHKGMTTVYVTEGRSIVNEGMNEKIHPDYIVEDLSGLAR
ncbi:MAG: HAD hydrolase-like protein [Bulleidia sp.]